ncbi:MAG: hypothetical protein AAFQ57_14430, partial [Cyanobacteria bacterium J06626_14]
MPPEITDELSNQDLSNSDSLSCPFDFNTNYNSDYHSNYPTLEEINAAQPLQDRIKVIGADIDRHRRHVTEIDSDRTDLSNIHYESKLVAVIGDMGRGKTTGLAINHSDDNVVFITPRVLLTLLGADTWTKWGAPMEDYKALQEAPGGTANLRVASRLAQCTPSITKMMDPETLAYPAFDINTFDEAKQQLRMLKDRAILGKDASVGVLDAFRELGRNAARIYLMDDHLCEQTLSIYEELFGIKAHVVINTRPYDRGDLIMLPSPRYAMQRVLEQVARVQDEQDVIAVHVTNLDIGEQLKTKAERMGFKVAFISARCTDNQGNYVDFQIKRLIDSLPDENNELLYEYDLIIYTSTMGTGVSCMNPIRAVAAIVDSRDVISDDIHQAINRFRNRQQTFVYVPRDRGIQADGTLNEEAKPLVTDVDTIIQRCLAGGDNYLQNYAKIPITRDANGKRNYQAELFFDLKVYATVVALENQQRNRQRSCFLEHTWGYSSIRFERDWDSDIELYKEFSDLRDYQQEKVKQLFLGNMVNDDDFREEIKHVIVRIKDAEQQLAEEGIGHNLILRLAEETRWGHEHYTLANTVGKSRLTGADYDILTKRGGLKRVFNLVDLLFEEMKDLAERDVWESRVENLVPVKDRKRRARKISVARPLLYQLYDSKIEPDREIPIEIHDFDEIAHNWLVAYSGELGKLYPEMAI